MSTPLADDFAAIKAALERLERDKKEAEAPKAWPDYTAVDGVYNAPGVQGECWGHYSAPTDDCAWRSSPIKWRELGKGGKIGTVLRIRLPADYKVIEGPAIDWAGG